MAGLYCDSVLLADGWATGVTLGFAPDGTIATVQRTYRSAGFSRADGIVIPGMPNLHSHAFQYAMAGMAERSGDGFWSWRKIMYRFADRIDPDALEAIAAQAYAEMLTRGYTAVGEFHYLHHDRDGAPYADPGEMSHRLIAAARRAGIALTHLPVLYAHGGFGELEPMPAQRRFVTASDRFAALLWALDDRYGDEPNLHIGMAAHSLRAVSPPLLAQAIEAYDRIRPDGPIHIHAAEQVQEVADCVQALGARPVEWLLDNHRLSERWCIVHATHMTESETTRLARSGAVAGLCPTTEANLGDGIFNAPTFLDAGGAFGIGSDSQVTIDPVQELRWFDYVQRLLHRKRGVLATGSPHPAAGLYRAAVAGGARALGWPDGGIAPGARADLVVLEAAHPMLEGRQGDAILDGYVFAPAANAVREVIVGGRRVVENGRHIHDARLRRAYGRAVRRLLA